MDVIPGTQTVDLVRDCLDLQKGLVLVNDALVILLVVIILIGSVVLRGEWAGWSEVRAYSGHNVALEQRH
jgi:hypothetical protein